MQVIKLHEFDLLHKFMKDSYEITAMLSLNIYYFKYLDLGTLGIVFGI